MKQHPWDPRVVVPEMLHRTFFTEDCTLAYSTYQETRNNVMRQYFYSVAEWIQSTYHAQVHPIFDMHSRVTTPPKRLAVFWPFPPDNERWYPGDYDAKLKWMSELFEGNYKVLQQQDHRLHSYDIRPYRLGYDFHDYGVQLEFLVPSYWPELELLPGPCTLAQLLDVLGRERKHARAKLPQF